LNEQLKQQHSDLAILTDEESAFKFITKTLSETSRYHSSTFTDFQYDLIFSKLLKWPSNMRFPILDLLRLMILHPSFARYISENTNLIMVILESGLTKDNTANNMLVLRFIANLFRWESLHNIVLQIQEMILDRLVDCMKGDSRTRMALATIIMNYSVLSLNQSSDKKIQQISILSELLSIESDPEILYRGSVALGNLIWEDHETRKLVMELDMIKSIQKHSQSTTSKLSECSHEILKQFS